VERRYRTARVGVIDPEYLTLEDSIYALRVLGVGPVRDIGLLDSALARPRSSAFGSDAYATLELKAAALLHSLLKNHPLVDGNKRLGWFCVASFLGLNNACPQISHDAAFQLVIEIASGSLELDEIARRLGVRSDSASGSLAEGEVVGLDSR
jgi:death on curing protein